MVAASVARADNGTWINTTGAGVWSDPANWASGVIADGASETATFSDKSITNTIHLDSSRTIGLLSFVEGSGNDSWTLDNNGNAANILTLDNAGNPNKPEIDLYTTQTATINAVLAGTQGLRIGDGDPSQGTLVLNGNDTFTGGLDLAAGNVRLGNSGALNSSTPNAVTFPFSSASLILAGNSVAVAGISGGASVSTRLNAIENDSPNSATLSITGAQSAASQAILRDGQGGGALSLVMNGSGSQSFGPNNTITGGVIVNSGQLTLSVVAPSFAGGVTVNNGQLTINVLSTFTGGMRINGGKVLVVGTDQSPTSLNSIVFGPGSLGQLSIQSNAVVSGLITDAVNLGTPTVGGSGTLTVNNATDNVFAGVLQDSLNLVKGGIGTLTLSGANTSTGTTTVNAGTLQVNGSNATVSSPMVNAGGTLSYLNGASAGSRPVTAVGAAAINSNLHGIVQFHNNSTAGSAALTTAGSNFANAAGAAAVFQDNSTAGSATLTTNGGSNGGFGGTAEFSDNSTALTATLITNGGSNGGLGGVTEFSGSATGGTAKVVTNAGGIFDISQSGGAGVAVGSIEGAGVYQLGGRSLTFGSLGTNTTVSGVISDGGINGGTAGSIVKVGSGTTTLSGANTYTGTTTVNAGTLVVNGANATISSPTVNAGGTLTYANGASAVSSTVTTNGSSILNAAGGVTIFQSSATALVATLITNGGSNGGLSGVTEFSGSGTGFMAKVVTNAGGTFDISQSGVSPFSVGSIEGGGLYRLGSRTLMFGSLGTDTTVSGVISDGGINGGTGGSIVKVGSGTTTLSGANTYTGTTTINAGTLIGGAANTFSSGSSVTVAAGAQLNLGGFSQTLGGLSGAGTVTTSGNAGVDILTVSRGSATFSGTISDASGGRELGLDIVGNVGPQLTLTGTNVLSGPISLEQGCTLSISGGSLVAAEAISINGGNFRLTAGTLSVAAGQVIVNTGASMLQAGGSSTADVINNGAFTYTGGTFTGRLVNSGVASFGGNVIVGKGIENDGSISLSSTLTLNGSGLTNEGTFTLGGGTLITSSIVGNGKFVFNAGTLSITQGDSSIGSAIVTNSTNDTINISATNVSLGDATSLTGFSHEGTLTVGANSNLTLNSAGVAKLGILTSITGGTINAPNGVTLVAGSSLTGGGTVNAEVSAAAGSVIQATGNLTLGAIGSPAGFHGDGKLIVGVNTVTINDSNAARLGTLVTLGSGNTPGILNVTNGALVDFDQAITGTGTINSTNALAQAIINNGLIAGNSASQPITLSGYVKGLGALQNVVVTGTYSPGLSPAVVQTANLSLAPTNALIVEIGGTTPGSGYDQIKDSGTLSLGGTLHVSLTGGFTPSAGNSFNILDWSMLAGKFSTLQLPSLIAPLGWDTTQLYTTGTLSVTASVHGDFDRDGQVTAADIQAMILALTDLKTYQSAHALSDTDLLSIGDVDGDGKITNADLQALIANLKSGGGSLAPVPEPPSIMLMVLAMVASIAIHASVSRPARISFSSLSLDGRG
jgi:fibronectin-binding autotransporter adhesin